MGHTCYTLEQDPWIESMCSYGDGKYVIVLRYTLQS